jgi:hypothetical protein
LVSTNQNGGEDAWLTPILAELMTSADIEKSIPYKGEQYSISICDQRFNMFHNFFLEKTYSYFEITEKRERRL